MTDQDMADGTARQTGHTEQPAGHAEQTPHAQATEQDTPDTPETLVPGPEAVAEVASAAETAAGTAGVTVGVSAEPGQVAAAPPPVTAEQHPEKWGRVDAEGTVYLRTEEGERAIGSWQAGTPDEGLLHFARRFDDLRTEVELLCSRLASGAGDAKHTLTSARHHLESLAEATVLGDVAALKARLEFLIAKAGEAVEAGKAAREAAKAEAVARKQGLADEAEKIAEEATQWKVAGDRLRAILDEWKTIKGVDRKVDEQLWKRFAKARDTFNRRRGSHFADLDRQRSAAKGRKQELVEAAEALSDSDDWGPTASRYRQLMTEWKAAGHAPKDADDALWQRFRAAQDKFFARRSETFNERDAELVANAKRKEELLAEAQSIDPGTDLEAARAALHRLQDQWDEVGKVPRERVRELEGKLRAVEDRVRQAADARWRRTDPEAEARAAQFRERVEQFEAQAAKARAAGDKRRAEQAEAQAAQWREWLAAAEQAVATR